MIRHLKRSPLNFTLYLLALALCIVIFKQSDLTHTYTSSYAYLLGHIRDFYDYNQPFMVRNDYLPLMYAIFALWNLPLKLLGLLTPAEMGDAVWKMSTPIEILWSKLMLATFFFASVVWVGKIANLIRNSREAIALNPSLLFATSPIAIFAVFIFSQYDVIGVFFTLLGLYFYFQKKFLRFALCFSVAISFKYFACFIYLPLVLIIEKRPIHILRYGLLGILMTALQIGFYWHSEVFQNSFFALAGDKTGEAMNRGKAIYLGLLYLALCGYAYVSKTPLTLTSHEWARKTILICTLAYALMFSLVRWHPQWLLILMPFFALATLYIHPTKGFLRLEVIAYIAFIWLCVNGWSKNVDVTMIQEGALHAYIPTLSYFGADLLSSKGEGLARLIFYLYLYSPFLFWVWQNRAPLIAKFKTGFANRTALAAKATNTPIDSNPLSRGESGVDVVVRWRILVGGYFFLAIALLCLYWSIG
jgi:hypothetical protein